MTRLSQIKHSSTTIDNLRHKLVLLVVMLCIGSFTAYAAANTYEVISARDVPISPTVKSIRLTSDADYDTKLVAASHGGINTGSFGVPQKIKFPETDRHVDIIAAKHDAAGWTASQGLAQRIITASPRQKIFGEALLYLRYNTPTTKMIGEVIPGDIVNVVTTDGWQLGYQVRQVEDDPVAIAEAGPGSKSRIIVVLRNENNGHYRTFVATLVKVGERV